MSNKFGFSVWPWMRQEGVKAIVGALYVSAELAAASSALRKLDVVPLRNSSLPKIGFVRKRKQTRG